jgi:preprotein translocase subunit SecB
LEMPPTQRPAVVVSEHAIQLEFIGVKEVIFRASRPPISIPRESINGPQYNLGRADYDAEQKRIQVFSKVEFATSDPKEFTFSVELVGQFVINEESFPSNLVEDWADRAAMYIILPYLREHVYSLSLRIGVNPPLMLPLLQLPKYTITAAQSEPQMATA